VRPLADDGAGVVAQRKVARAFLTMGSGQFVRPEVVADGTTTIATEKVRTAVIHGAQPIKADRPAPVLVAATRMVAGNPKRVARFRHR